MAHRRAPSPPPPLAVHTFCVPRVLCASKTIMRWASDLVSKPCGCYMQCNSKFMYTRSCGVKHHSTTKSHISPRLCEWRKARSVCYERTYDHAIVHCLFMSTKRVCTRKTARSDPQIWTCPKRTTQAVCDLLIELERSRIARLLENTKTAMKAMLEEHTSRWRRVFIDSDRGWWYSIGRSVEWLLVVLLLDVIRIIANLNQDLVIHEQ